VESELLLLPLEQKATALPRVFLARALLLLSSEGPGSALLAIDRAPEGVATPELEVGRARIQAALERPDLARRSLDAAHRADPKLLEALLTAADLARAGRRFEEAADGYRAALTLNPLHVPSLLGLAELALERGATEAAGQAGRPVEDQGGALRGEAQRVADELDRSLAALPAEASPGEQCRLLLDLVQLDLILGHALTAPNHLDRAADLDDAPADCQLDLARLDRRLGRGQHALALLRKAADAEDPGTAPLALAEALEDPADALRWASRPPPPEFTPEERIEWTSRADATRVRAELGLGQRQAAADLAVELLEIQTVEARLALARLRHTQESRGSRRLLGAALRLARDGKRPGDELAEVGEVALSLDVLPLALEACDAAVERARDNCRALICSARALHGEGKDDLARARLDQALLLNPTAEGAEELHAKLAPTP
jgi:tetratricopeptide (TPR) repeat protein